MMQPQYVTQHMQVNQVVQYTNWKEGICGCCSRECELCCNVFWCTPCMAGRTHSAAVNNLRDTMDGTVTGSLIAAEVLGIVLSFSLTAAGIPGMGFCSYMGCCATAGYLTYQRQFITKKFNIHSEPCMDCLMSFFCLPCVLCQHHTELSHRGVDPGSCCCIIGQQRPRQTAVVMVAHHGQVMSYPQQQVQPAYPSHGYPVQGQAVMGQQPMFPQTHVQQQQPVHTGPNQPSAPVLMQPGHPPQFVVQQPHLPPPENPACFAPMAPANQQQQPFPPQIAPIPDAPQQPSPQQQQPAVQNTV
eukprot:TRINITY_DN13065_c0_g1_i1.p1 TRINITY_DN13065_c0_g1~~TRINITY_DN13065_c0_g1_i1.p1  ORF type:complete len:333 (+),score=42.71 TRINITY_DN13065_c0_g1_i1:100-999(+)